MSKRCWPGWPKLFAAGGSLLWASMAAAIPPGPYFPLPDGATWTYAHTSGGSATRTVTGSMTFNGNQVRVVQHDSGSQQYFSNDTSGIRFHGAFVVDFVNGGTETDTYA